MENFNWAIIFHGLVFFAVAIFVAWALGNDIAKDNDITDEYKIKLEIFFTSFILLWIGYGIALAW